MVEVMSFTITPSKATLIPPLIRSSPQMNLVFNIPSTMIYPTLSCSHPKTPNPFRTAAAAAGFQRTPPPARDRVIDFGKYKGKMLGSLPSSYLKWISQNLRAGDTEEWARFSDQVLTDPVYRDRIEWEVAENVLNGNAAASPNSNGDGSGAVKELLEISERFGWDNEDKIGWSKVNFGLLGTTHGGRIPRLRNEETKEEKTMKAEIFLSDDGGRRRERRERVMRRRRVEKTSRMVVEGKEEIVNGGGNDDDDDDNDEDGVRAIKNRFPGRKALLNKVLNRQKKF